MFFFTISEERIHFQENDSVKIVLKKALWVQESKQEVGVQVSKQEVGVQESKKEVGVQESKQEVGVQESKQEVTKVVRNSIKCKQAYIQDEI